MASSRSLWSSMSRTSPPLRLTRLSPQELVATRSRARSLFELLGTLTFFAVWYLWLFGMTRPSAGDFIERIRELTAEQPFMWVFVLAPLLAVPRLLRLAMFVAQGESFSFNALTRTVSRNGEVVARFDEVEGLQIRTIGGELAEYRLSMVLRGGDRVTLDQDSDIDGICGIADAIADVTGTSISRKG